MNSSTILGVDIGGSHITAAWVNLGAGTVLNHTCTNELVNAHGTREEIISSWSNVIRKAITFFPETPLRIGIAMPGPFDYERGVSFIKGNDKYESLYNQNVKTLLAEQLSIRSESVRLKNDAECFLQGEVMAGAARRFNHAIGITLGTGVGTASYHGGVSEDADLWRFPFLEGIAEDYISTRWFVRRYHELTGGNIRDVKELALRSETEVTARNVFTEFARNFSDFLIMFIQKEEPDVVVIGGNIMYAHELFLPQVKAHLAEHSIHIPIRRSVLGEEAAMIGAAGCWMGSRFYE